jgi:hypothetical protein
MSRNYNAIFLSILIFLSVITGCSKGNNEPIADDLVIESFESANNSQNSVIVNESPSLSKPSLPEQQPTNGENSIDRAFIRINIERKGELQGNTIYSYLYAQAWEMEFRSLEYELLDEKQNPSWDTYLSHYHLYETAIEYAKKRSDSSNATVLFEWIARFYKLLAFDCIAQFDELGIIKDIRTDEDELYQKLDEVNYEKQIYDDYNSVAVSIHEDLSNPMPVYADIRDEGVYLAFAAPFGAVLTVNGNDYLYPWSGGELTPRLVMPRLFLSDYDNDGANELAVVLYVGSGTSVAIEELHIIELEYMDDFIVTGETVEEKLFLRMLASYNPSADEIKIQLDNQLFSFDASSASKERYQEFDGLDFRDMIYFDAADGTLSVRVYAGLCGFDYSPPFDYVDLNAQILYISTTQYRAPYISLVDCRIGPPSWE